MQSLSGCMPVSQASAEAELSWPSAFPALCLRQAACTYPVGSKSEELSTSLFFSPSGWFTWGKKAPMAVGSGSPIAVPQANTWGLPEELPSSIHLQLLPAVPARCEAPWAAKSLEHHEESLRLPRPSLQGKLRSRAKANITHWETAMIYPHSERLIFYTVYYNYFWCL